MKISFDPAWIRSRLWRNGVTILFGTALFSSSSFAQATTPVVQLRGTIKTISSEGSKAKSESPFELDATDEKYSLQVTEAASQPAFAGYYVSNLHDIFTSVIGVAPDGPQNIQVRKTPAMVSFSRGSLPLKGLASASRAQVLAYAYVATRLPHTGTGDADFADQLNPQIITAAAEMEKSDFQTQVVRRADGSLERISFWGLRPGTNLKTFENTKDTFLLASLVFKEVVGTMPVSGVFTLFGKRPGLTGKLVSFERRRFEFSGAIGSTTEREAFGCLTYNAEPVLKRITVFDYRFVEEDGGKVRSYGLSRGDELPFAEEKLPMPYYLMPKPNSGEAPQVVRKAKP